VQFAAQAAAASPCAAALLALAQDTVAGGGMTVDLMAAADAAIAKEAEVLQAAGVAAPATTAELDGMSVVADSLQKLLSAGGVQSVGVDRVLGMLGLGQAQDWFQGHQQQQQQVINSFKEEVSNGLTPDRTEGVSRAITSCIDDILQVTGLHLFCGLADNVNKGEVG
jgi:hypothetical protein